jgi:hypothetical protein
MLKFINGLPEKLAFYVRSSKPEDIAEAISLAKAGEACTYRVHGESVAAAKADNDDISYLKRQIGKLTTCNMVQRMSCEQQMQYSANYNHNGAKSQGPSHFSTICHNCNSQGHIKKYCNWNGRGNVYQNLHCQLCSQKGHLTIITPKTVVLFARFVQNLVIVHQHASSYKLVLGYNQIRKTGNP